MTTRILWTVLPNGIVDGKHLRFSLYASPRLETSAPDVLGSFPISPKVGSLAARVLDMSLAVTIGGLSAKAERIKLPGMPDPDKELSAFLLPETTPVRGFAVKDNTARNVRSFDVAVLSHALDAIATEAASQGTKGFPVWGDPKSPLAQLLQALAQVGLSQGEGPLAQGKVQDQARLATDGQLLKLAGSLSDPAHAAIAGEFLRAYFFYLRAPRKAEYDATIKHPQIVADAPEFHEILTALGDNPTLLRQLGVVSDWVIPNAIVPGQLPGDMVLAGLGALPKEATIAVLENSAFDGVVNEKPATAYRISPAGFLPRPDVNRPSDINEGMLRMGAKTGFAVVSRDVDGGAIKVLDHAVNVARWQLKDAKNTPESHSLPVSRSAGLTVAKQGRAAVTTKSFQVALKLEAATRGNPTPGSSLLYADDVRRGYRVDVYVAEVNKWYSLVARGGAYTVGGTTFAPGDAEGYVKSSGGTSEIGDTGPSARLFVHEALFGWDGWSLAARRPGKAVMLDSAVDVANEPKHVPVKTEWRVTPGTLPKLRYGRTYQLRARVVDLAGNSLPFSDETTKVMPSDAPTAAVKYLRHEPISAPALVPQRAFGEGESLERLVIRGDRDVPAEKYAAITLGPDGMPRYVGRSFRHVAPPKTSQIEAETLGMLDGFDAATQHHISSKEEGTFLDTVIFDWKTGGEQSVTDGVLVSKHGNSLPIMPKGKALAEGEYVVHTSDAATLPYLPDPLSHGVSVWSTALRTDEASPHVPSPFVDEGWPAVRVSRFRLVEAAPGNPASITADANGNILVRLPPGTILPAKMASLPAEVAAKTMALWEAAVAGDKVGTQTGRNWTISPARDVTFVHAVQHPLVPAVIGKFYSPYRASGDTSVVVRGDMKVHGRSTSDVDMRAAWTDLVDRTTEDKATYELHTGRAFELKVTYQQDTRAIGDGKEQGARHELGDTKHRNIAYRPDSVSRYREYFPLEVIVDPANVTTPGELGMGGVLVPTDAGQPYFRDGMLNVPSSARPVPPQVLYVIPTFRWETSPDGSTVTRKGRGLRIYLDRPWFTTGVGERLAVLVEPGSAAARQYVSEWASDPLWTATAPKEDLARKHFADVTYPPDSGDVATHPERTYKRVVGPFSLAEDPSLTAVAVALMPEFHEERKLWFVDVELDPGAGAYFPFVRLALARCQPDSIGGHELSTVVKAEIAQLTPDRTATVTMGATLDVAVSGVVALNAFGVFAAGWKPPVTPPPVSGAATTPTVPGGIGNLPKPLPIDIPDPKAGAGRRVTGQLQRRANGESDLAWVAVAGEVSLSPYHSLFGGADTVFRGTVPGIEIYKKETAAFEHRVLVREYETYVVDQETAPNALAERIAYAAEIRLGIALSRGDGGVAACCDLDEQAAPQRRVEHPARGRRVEGGLGRDLGQGGAIEGDGGGLRAERDHLDSCSERELGPARGRELDAGRRRSLRDRTAVEERERGRVARDDARVENARRRRVRVDEGPAERVVSRRRRR
jgi:hypothetical protein